MFSGPSHKATRMESLALLHLAIIIAISSLLTYQPASAADDQGRDTLNLRPKAGTVVRLHEAEKQFCDLFGQKWLEVTNKAPGLAISGLFLTLPLAKSSLFTILG